MHRSPVTPTGKDYILFIILISCCILAQLDSSLVSSLVQAAALSLDCSSASSDWLLCVNTFSSCILLLLYSWYQRSLVKYYNFTVLLNVDELCLHVPIWAVIVVASLFDLNMH